VTVTDIVLVLIFAGAFIVGFFQGVVRGLLAIAAWLVAFILAANLRGPVGDYLARQWANLDSDYVHMLAVIICTLVIFGALMTAIIVYAKGPRGFSSYTLLDDLLGGLIGVVLSVVILASGIVMLVSVYGPLVPGAETAFTADWSAQAFRALADSSIGQLISDTVVPLMGLVFGGIVPDVIREAMA
jgi:uncharacterized membrane protein required for colicin V production